MKKDWESTRVTNLVLRVQSSIYYAQVKIRGKTYRRSLATSKFSVAKLKLPKVLAEIRGDAERTAEQCGTQSFETLGDCLNEWIMLEKARPDLAESSRRYNQRRYEDLLRMLPVDKSARQVGDAELRTWWKTAAEHYNPQYANNLLAVVRKLVDMQVDARVRRKNVTLDFKKMPIPKTIKQLPAGGQLTRVIQDVRAQNKRESEQCADMIAWLAYTGMRPGEALRLKWRDVGKDFITIRHEQMDAARVAQRTRAERTKNYRERQVPIMQPLREIIDRRRGAPDSLLWSLKTPRRALANSCKRLNIQHMTVYDLRHFFATGCLESGVDVPTVSKWLGHQDGGALVMETYGHVSDRHGLEVSKKVNLE